MDEIIKILMRRDNMSEDDAVAAVKDFKVTINQALEGGWSLCEIEETFQEEFFLEPDYLFALLPI